MRKPTRVPLGQAWLLVVLSLGGAAAPACSTRSALGSGKAGNSGAGGIAIVGAGGAGGSVATGIGGAAGIAAPCAGASDDRLVIAGQRVLRLTMNETLNTIRYLVGDAEAAALVSDGMIGAGDDSDDTARRFPPLQDPDITSDNFPPLDAIAQHVGDYVLGNFASVSACPAATDDCATAYLDKLAARAYRRQLTVEEQGRFATLYSKLRTPQVVNGYQVTFTVEEATSYAVTALLESPQMLWRWELGNPALASTAPPGIPLTDTELATQLAFFLTDQPPDDTLLAAANAGTLRANLAAEVNALLASSVTRDWLRTVMETYFEINQLTRNAAAVNVGLFPAFTPATVSDMRVEARKFLDNALWNGILTDLLLSRTAFLNSNLAANIYGVPVPAGATATSFVQTALPATERSGLLTNAAFLASRANSDGHALVVPRGKLVSAVLLCVALPAPPTEIPPTAVGSKPIAQQTSQEQVAFRASQPVCNDCHAQFDPYGLALDNYDDIGRYRTVDDLGQPVDAHATLPAIAGGGTVHDGVELAQAIAASPAFTNCVARTLLQYAMVDLNDYVELPQPPQQAGCATADLVERYQAANGKTFTDLVRATAASPAFTLRRAAP